MILQVTVKGDDRREAAEMLRHLAVMLENGELEEKLTSSGQLKEEIARAHAIVVKVGSPNANRV